MLDKAIDRQGQFRLNTLHVQLPMRLAIVLLKDTAKSFAQPKELFNQPSANNSH